MTIKISNNAIRLLFEIWEKLDFSLGTTHEWPDPDSCKEADFLRAPIHIDTIRLVELAIENSCVDNKDEALKELIENKLLLHFSSKGRHPTVLTRSYIYNYWEQYCRDPQLFQKLFNIKDYEEADTKVALWEYRASVSLLHKIDPQNIEKYSVRVERAKAKYELILSKYAPLHRSKEKLHDRILGLLYALLGGIVGTLLTFKLTN